MVSYERPKTFKISLSKVVDVLSEKNDKLKTNKKEYLRNEMFKLEALVNQNPEHTEFLYKSAKGQNVTATFEKLHREVMDLQFAASFTPSLAIAPVVFSVPAITPSCQEIVFETRRYSQHVKIHLKLSSQPKSIVFPNAAPAKVIRMGIDRKIPGSIKLKDSFEQFMNGGGLLVHFIMDSLWPAIMQAKELKKEQFLKQLEPCKNEQEKASITIPVDSRTFAGSERRDERKIGNRKDSRDNHRDNYQANRKRDERNANGKGAPIPRHNPQLTHSRNPKGPIYQNQSSQNFELKTLLSMNDVSKTVGGSFGLSRRENFPTTSSGSQEYRSDAHQRSSGKHRRGSKSRGPAGRGSESNDWRRNQN